MSEENTFSFEMKNIFRSPMLLLGLLISLIFSFGGLWMAMFLPYLLLSAVFLIPLFYGWMPRLLIRFGFTSLAKRISFLPLINYRGTWLLETNSEIRELSSWTGFRTFTFDFFKYLAIPLIVMRVALGELQSSLFGEVEEISSVDILLGSLQYLIPLFVFVLIFTIRDVELKHIKPKENSLTIDKLEDSSDSVIGLVALLFGTALLTVVLDIEISVFAQFLVEIGIPYFTCLIFYQTPFYKNNVNSIRNYLLTNAERFGITIGFTEYEDLFCNNCSNINKYPNYFCTNCANDLSQMSSRFVSDPISIGTLVTVAVDAKTINPASNQPISTWYKVFVVIVFVLCIVWYPFLPEYLDIFIDILSQFGTVE